MFSGGGYRPWGWGFGGMGYGGWGYGGGWCGGNEELERCHVIHLHVCQCRSLTNVQLSHELFVLPSGYHSSHTHVTNEYNTYNNTTNNDNDVHNETNETNNYHGEQDQAGM